MSGDLSLEQRYRRVLRLLPGYYLDKWEEDMVAAFLDSWLTGDPEVDGCVLEFGRPTWPEVASVVTLAARLYLGSAGAPRRYLARGQAVRSAVLAVVLVHAVRAVDGFVRLAWARRLLGVPGPPVYLPIPPWGGIWSAAFYAVGCAWIVVFAALVVGQYRAARVLAALAIVPSLVALLQSQLTGASPVPFGPWAFWVLFALAPVVAMGAFCPGTPGAPPAARRRWLLALPVGYLLVYAPLLAVQATGNVAWLPDTPGLFCLLVSLACLAHAPRTWSSRSPGSGVWSLTLTLLAAVTAVYRTVSLAGYRQDSHLIYVSLAELLILAAAVALVAVDAVRTQTATPAPLPHSHPA
jgi:hypothetical protein